MAAGTFSFTIEQGATTDFELVYKDSSGNPVNLSGHTARMQLKDSIGGSNTNLLPNGAKVVNIDSKKKKLEINFENEVYIFEF